MKEDKNPNLQEEDFNEEEEFEEEFDENSIFNDGIIIGLKLKKDEDPTAFLSIIDRDGAENLIAGAILDVANTKTCTVYLDHIIKYMQANPDEASIITSALAIIKSSINLEEDNEIAVRPTEVFNRE